MTTLVVAAGGGGDAVGALLARRFIEPGDGPLLVASCAWERLRIDPTPGPRPASDFHGLADVGGRAVEVTPESDTIPPGRSMLPRLSADECLRLFLLDLHGGAVGLAGQLSRLAAALDVSRLVVLDVGGDAIASGAEPGLRSPIADALAVAAAALAGVPAEVLVVGPGADGELMADEVHHRAKVVGAELLGSVDRDDAATVAGILDWHPTEATAAVAASAAGLRGAVETRQGSAVPLGPTTTEVWGVSLDELDAWPIVSAVAGSSGLGEASVAARGMGSTSELDAEAAIANRAASAPRSPLTQSELLRQLADDPGAVPYLTTRRLLEIARCPVDRQAPLLASLRPRLYAGHGLWCRPPADAPMLR